MSNVPSTTLANVPAHIAARIAARQQAGQRSAITSAIAGDGVVGPRISIKAGRYRLVEDGVETVVGINLDVIVVGANPRVSKVFYAGAYDPNAVDARPACFSHDGVAPDASVGQPVHSNCTSCPNNVLGSKILPSGAKSKLCSDQRHLGVVPAADPTKVYSFTVPVSGMKGLREYFKELDNFGLSPEEVITELGFDDSVSYPKVTFKQKGYVPAKAVARIDELVVSDEVKLATRVLDPRTARPALAGTQAKPARTSQQAAAPAAAPAPAPAAAPAVDDAYETEAAASAAAPAPAPAAPPVAQGKPEVAPVSEKIMEEIDNLFGD